MGLFQFGDFQLASGDVSLFKIDCDALTPKDWEALAFMASRSLQPFGNVVGVPRGGLPFADALRKYVTEGSQLLLIAEDVVTTGGSIIRFRNNRVDVIGVCVFARGDCPTWVTPLFRM